MAEARIRNIDWKDDIDLRNDLAKFVRVNLRRLEILDFVRKGYPIHAWSLRSLARRMQHFGIQFTDHNGLEERGVVATPQRSSVCEWGEHQC